MLLSPSVTKMGDEVSLTRRLLLGGSLAGLAAWAAGRCLPTARAAPRRTKSRTLVVIQLSGGPDAILTLDPKDRAEVEGWVDNPQQSDNVEAGGIRLGAHFAPLAPWASRMAIVKGVRVESVNHPAATWQLMRMRRKATRNVPSLLDLLARHRGARPLGSLTLGDVRDRAFSPSWLVDDSAGTFAALEGMAAPDLEVLARAARHHEGDASLRPADRESYGQLAAFLERLPACRRFATSDWGAPPRFTRTASALQRTLWAIEHDLIAGASVIVTTDEWDTHYNGLARQTQATAAFVPLLQQFLTGLASGRNAGGPLLDSTTVVVTGELGRFPRVNSEQGKDHFPELAMLLLGAGIHSGMFGQTGKDMLGLPMDPASGKIRGSRYLTLDDVGTTLLHLFGIEPTQYGYAGRVIEGLVA